MINGFKTLTSVIVQQSTVDVKLSRNKNKRRHRHTHCIFTYRSVVDVYIISACLMSSVGSVAAVAHGEERVVEVKNMRVLLVAAPVFIVGIYHK